MSTQQPSVGRIVHYVSYGTPGGEYTSECRAAVVAAVPAATWQEDLGEGQPLDLVVLNPMGLFFNRAEHHEGDVGHDHAGEEIPARSYRGGTWHWPCVITK